MHRTFEAGQVIEAADVQKSPVEDDAEGTCGEGNEHDDAIVADGQQLQVRNIKNRRSAEDGTRDDGCREGRSHRGQQHHDGEVAVQLL